MPSIFSRPKQPTIQTISAPILCDPPTLKDFEGETRYMQIPTAPLPPPPPPPPPPPSSRPRRPELQPKIIIPPTARPYAQTSTSKFHENFDSPSSVYSFSDWDDESIAPSSPGSSMSSNIRTTKQIPRDASASLRQNSPSPGARFPGGANHAPIPFTLPPPSTSAQMQSAKTLPPTPRTDALARGLSQRYGPPSRNVTQTRPHPAATTPTGQPAIVRTRTNTRKQGRWLSLGTTRIDPKELKREEKEAEIRRKRDEEEALRANKKMMKEARKAGKGK